MSITTDNILMRFQMDTGFGVCSHDKFYLSCAVHEVESINTVRLSNSRLVSHTSSWFVFKTTINLRILYLYP